MKCKDCGREITELHRDERICGRCAIGYDMLYGEDVALRLFEKTKEE